MDIITYNSEPRLMKMLVELRDNPRGTAIHFHFSKLSSHYRTSYHLRIALNTISEHLINHNGATFILENHDIIIILFSTKAEIIDRLIFHLRRLYIDDPISQSDGFGENSLCSVYFLSFEMQALIHRCDELMKDYQIRIKQQKIQGNKGNYHITSDVIRSIESKLLNTDISKFIRRQPIAAITDINAKPKTIYDEVYVSLIHFKKILGDRITECSDRLINQFLFEKLDEIMIKHIIQNTETFLNIPVSLNLNIATIIDETFQEFLNAIPANKKLSVIVEFQLSDIFYDMAGYKVAHDILHAQNIRICIDGINNLSLLQIDRQSLDADLVKLQWNSDIAKNFNKVENQLLVSKIMSIEPTRIILSRCDDAQAVQYGKDLGIKMFQGWHIDKILGYS